MYIEKGGKFCHTFIQVGETYDQDCDIFTCKKTKKKYKFVKSLNKTRCCKYEGKNYKV